MFKHLCHRCISEKTTESFANLLTLYPPFQSEFEEEWTKLKSIKLKDSDFKLKGSDYLKAKLKLIMVDLFLGDEVDLLQETRNDIVTMIFADAQSKGWLTKVMSLFVGSVDDPRTMEYAQRAEDYEKRAKNTLNELDDITFLSGLTDTSKYGGDLAANQISKILQSASSFFIEELPRLSNRLKSKFHRIRHTVLKKQIDAVVSGKRDKLYGEWRSDFIQALHDAQAEQKEKSPERS